MSACLFRGRHPAAAFKALADSPQNREAGARKVVEAAGRCRAASAAAQRVGTGVSPR